MEWERFQTELATQALDFRAQFEQFLHSGIA
jgi:hypothetical protein